ncbi:MAG: hypothetical protein JO199_05180 [Candidatus Eremiobacteraeota bacterium]|nr:hypothetical protein [Candidatus Eremiobacteraeota bacterium]
MRFSMIRTGVVAIAASIALAACGGHGLVPAQSGGTGYAPTNVSIPMSKSPCDVTGLWYFMGSCLPGVVKPAGGTYKLPAYQGITVQIQLGSNTAPSAGTKFLFADATGKNDITGTYGGHKFPPYSEKTCASHNACPGASAVYLEAINGQKSSTPITFHSTTTLTVDEKTFPGKSCSPGLLGQTGWSYFPEVTGNPKAGKLVLKIQANPLFKLPKGPAYISIVCK